MAPSQSKMAKKANTSSYLVFGHEPRMFNEKIIYLQKTTTKYVIVGLDMESFEPIVRICDRSSGDFVSIKLNDDYDDFARNVHMVVKGTYELDGHCIKGAAENCGIKFELLGNNVWRLNSVAESTSIVAHKSTLKNFLRLYHIILRILMTLDAEGYQKYINQLRDATEDMNEAEISAYLDKKIAKCIIRSTEYAVLLDVICNRDSLLDYKEYNEEFYNRKP